MIKAEIVAHSLNPQGDELISVLCTFPRIILAEVNTHRMLSKNTSSSRAIPFKKMVETIQNNPFIPIAWQKEHSGMQGSEYFEDSVDIAANTANWLEGRDRAVATAYWLNDGKVTKQLCNRLLEPFMWTTMLITGSIEGWNNFFHLRCPVYESHKGVQYKSWKDIVQDSTLFVATDLSQFSTIEKLQQNKGQAEIHMMALAEAIWDARNESTPKQLKAGEWHIPFDNKISHADIWDEVPEIMDPFGIPSSVKISTAMGARTSYTIIGEEKKLDLKTLVSLHDRLINQSPAHSSPMEHCAKAMDRETYLQFNKGRLESIQLTADSQTYCPTEETAGWCYNIKGFIPYRYIVDNKL